VCVEREAPARQGPGARIRSTSLDVGPSDPDAQVCPRQPTHTWERSRAELSVKVVFEWAARASVPHARTIAETRQS
jgi:hypothetical protein